MKEKLHPIRTLTLAAIRKNPKRPMGKTLLVETDDTMKITDPASAVNIGKQ
jgi:hypothetical protein